MEGVHQSGLRQWNVDVKKEEKKANLFFYRRRPR